MIQNKRQSRELGLPFAVLENLNVSSSDKIYLYR